MNKLLSILVVVAFAMSSGAAFAADPKKEDGKPAAAKDKKHDGKPGHDKKDEKKKDEKKKEK